MIEKISGIRGMNDLLPEELKLWSFVERKIISLFNSYGYEEIRTPILENTSLFQRGIGEVTDIVEKEMYSFTDNLNGNSYTLRPENTASVMRSNIEHHLTYNGPRKLWYFGPMFRHERPQQGRYRQFYQFGIEAIGYVGFEIEAEQLFMISKLWSLLGLSKSWKPKLYLNCLGTLEERSSFRKALIDFFSIYKDVLDKDSLSRLERNPLRILDSKNQKIKDLISEAPEINQFMGKESLKNFSNLCNLLEERSIPYELNSSLVRGLDYYNSTVFEWVTPFLGSQEAVCGGGRYDHLVEMLGGKPNGACGFAIGMERLVSLLKKANVLKVGSCLDLYIVHIGSFAKIKGLLFSELLRAVGISVKVDMTDASIKSQMKKAGLSTARFVAIFSKEYLDEDAVVIRPIHAPNSVKDEKIGFRTGQEKIKLNNVIKYLQSELSQKEISK